MANPTDANFLGRGRGWMAAGVVALAMGAESKVIWVCVVGAALGFTGIRYSIRRNRRSAI